MCAFGRDRGRNRDRGAPNNALAVYDFTQQSPGALILPAGWSFSRASNGHTVQIGTNALLENNGGSVNLGNNIGRVGRMLDAHAFGMFVEPSTQNLFLNNRNPTLWAAGAWSSTASGNADAAGGSNAYRAQTASGGSGKYYVTGTVSGTYTATAWYAKGPGSGSYALAIGLNTAAVAGTAPAAWTRVSLTATVTSQQFYHVPMAGSDTSGYGGVVAGARDALVDFCQLEARKYATSIVGNAGTQNTRAGERPAITAAEAARIVVGGRLGIYLKLRALCSWSEMGASEGTLLSWNSGNGQVAINPSGGANPGYLYAYVDPGESRTANNVITWNALDQIEFVIEVGAGRTSIRWSVNGGAWNTAIFSVSDATMDPFVTNAGIDVCNSGAAFQFPCILEKAIPFVPGHPPV